MINRIDITKQATDRGWTLPEGWEVIATLDWEREYLKDPREEIEALTDLQVQAWRDDDWDFTTVEVSVLDDSGRTWGRDSLGMTAYGYMPAEDPDDERIEMDPLHDSTIEDHGMVDSACREALAELTRLREAFIVPPTETQKE